MPQINLNATLHLAGPYAQMERADCWFALAVSGGLTDEIHTSAEKQRWLPALLPWILLEDSWTVSLWLDHDAGLELIAHDVPLLGKPVAGVPPLPPDPFGESVRAQVQTRMASDSILESALFKWPGNSEIRIVNGDTPTKHLSIGAALHTLSRLPASVSTRIRAVSYFQYDATSLVRPGVKSRLIAVPHKITDAVQAKSFEFSGTIGVSGRPDMPPYYTATFKGAAPPFVLSEGLDLAAIRRELVAPSSSLNLRTYWVPVAPDDLKSLSRAEELALRVMEAEKNVMSLTPVDVLGWVTVNGKRLMAEEVDPFRTAALQVAKRLDAAWHVPNDPRTEYENLHKLGHALLKSALSTGGDARARLREALRAEIARQLREIANALPAPWTGAHFEADAVESILKRHAAEQPQPEPRTTAEALEFTLGDTATRLTHRDQEDSGALAPALQQILGLGVMVWRVDPAHPDTPRWRLVTAGVPVVGVVDDLFLGDPAKSWLKEMKAAPVTAAFVNNLLSTDLAYMGVPMTTKAALDDVHPHRPLNDFSLDSLLVDVGVQTLGALLPGVLGQAQCRTPPLRYGDTYRVAAFVVDKVGAVPAELRNGSPYEIDFARLESALIPSLADHQLLRCFPIGSLKIAPSKRWASIAEPPRPMNEWLPLPAGVALRVRERLDAAWHGKPLSRPTDTLPTLVFRAPGDSALALDERFELRVEPPTIDEHVLSRWEMPAIGEAGAADKVKRLKQSMGNLFESRLPLKEGDKPHDLGKLPLPHEPAIRAIRLTAKSFWFGVGGSEDANEENRLIRLRSDASFRWRSPRLRVEHGSVPARFVPIVDAIDDGGLTLLVPRGGFSIVAVHALVAERDWQDRIDQNALSELVDSSVAEPGYVALKPEYLVVENAVADMPDEADLYKALRLERSATGVDVALDELPDTVLAWLDEYTIKRQRWVWRNRPLVNGEDLVKAAVDPYEMRRLLASGLPRELLSAKADERDAAGPLFDSVAELDHGLPNRDDVPGKYPRDNKGKPVKGPLLIRDSLDAIRSAQYLRYGLSVQSRYAPLFTNSRAAIRTAGIDSRDPTTKVPWKETWRRIATPFTGEIARIKPPKVLAVIPMTHGFQLSSDTAVSSTGATPVLVLLDEIWFREYGTGERLEARLSLENIDIGEQPTEPRPYKAGPLPDHYTMPPAGAVPYPKERYYQGKLVNEAEDQISPVLLKAFGPFGYSFDRSGNEALANASAFIVYPPDGVGPHWAMFLRFARVLDLPSHGARSSISDAHAVYTLPDARMLALPKSEGGMLRLRAGRVDVSEVELFLSPLDTVEAPARENYLYCLLVSEIAYDGGRGVEVELPKVMVCLSTDPLGVSYSERNAESLVDRKRYAARVIEIELRRRGVGPGELDTSATIGEFWRRLLPSDASSADPTEQENAANDALGAVRRVSPRFDLIKEP